MYIQTGNPVFPQNYESYASQFGSFFYEALKINKNMNVNQWKMYQFIKLNYIDNYTFLSISRFLNQAENGEILDFDHFLRPVFIIYGILIHIYLKLFLEIESLKGGNT